MPWPRKSALPKVDSTLTQIGFVSTPCRNTLSDYEDSELEQRDSEPPVRSRKRRKISGAQGGRVFEDSATRSDRDPHRQRIDTPDLTARQTNSKAAHARLPEKQKLEISRSRSRKAVNNVVDGEEGKVLEERTNTEPTIATDLRRSKRVKKPGLLQLIRYPSQYDGDNSSDEDERFQPKRRRTDKTMQSTATSASASSAGSLSGKKSSTRKQTNTLTQMINNHNVAPGRALNLQSQWQQDWESQGVLPYISPKRLQRDKHTVLAAGSSPRISDDLGKETASVRKSKSFADTPAIVSVPKTEILDHTPKKCSQHRLEIPSSQTPSSTRSLSRNSIELEFLQRSPLKEKSVNPRINSPVFGKDGSYLQGFYKHCDDEDATKAIASEVTRSQFAGEYSGQDKDASLCRTISKEVLPVAQSNTSTRQPLKRISTVQDSQSEDESDEFDNTPTHDLYSAKAVSPANPSNEKHEQSDSESEQATYDPVCSALDRDAARAWQETHSWNDCDIDVDENGQRSREQRKVPLGENGVMIDETTDDDLDTPSLGQSRSAQDINRSRNSSSRELGGDARGSKESTVPRQPVFYKGGQEIPSDPVDLPDWEVGILTSSEPQLERKEEVSQVEAVPCSQLNELEQGNESHPSDLPSSPLGAISQRPSQTSTIVTIQHPTCTDRRGAGVDSVAHSSFASEWPYTIGSSSPLAKPPWSSPDRINSSRMLPTDKSSNPRFDNTIDFSLPPPPPMSSLRGTPGLGSDG